MAIGADSAAKQDRIGVNKVAGILQGAFEHRVAQGGEGIARQIENLIVGPLGIKVSRKLATAELTRFQIFHQQAIASGVQFGLGQQVSRVIPGSELQQQWLLRGREVIDFDFILLQEKIIGGGARAPAHLD